MDSLNGNTDWLREELEARQEALFAFVAGLLHGRASDVRDVLQNINAAILSQVQKYDAQKSSPMTWFLAIARNQVRVYFAKLYGEKIDCDTDFVEALATQSEREAEFRGVSMDTNLDALEHCLGRLSSQKRELLEEHYTRGKRLRSISEEHHISIASITKLFYRMRKALHDCVEKTARRFAFYPARAPKIKFDDAESFETLATLFLARELTAAGEKRFCEEVAASQEKARAYLEQAYMHAMLAAPTAGVRKQRLKVSAIAAGIALILGSALAATILRHANATGGHSSDNTVLATESQKKETTMNATKATAITLAAISPILSAASESGSVDVGYRDRKEISVAEGETSTQSTRVSMEDYGKLYKTGKGKLELPLANVVQGAPFRMSVLDGTLKIVAGADKPTVAQPECLAQAGLWMNTDSAIVTNGNFAKIWLDVRANGNEADTQYIQAKPYWWHNQDSSKVSPTDGEPPMLQTQGLYFGGYGNGKGMTLHKPDGSYYDLQNIHHAYVVYAYKDSWGFFLGNVDSTLAGFKSGNSKDFHSNAKNSFMSMMGDGARAMKTGQVFLDGTLIAPGSAHPRDFAEGPHVLECNTVDRRANFSAFMLDSTYAENRGGGDWLCEVVVFTNHLSLAERNGVRNWLMNKWNIPGAKDAAIEVTTAGKLEVDGSAQVRPLGEGTLVKSGTGTFTLASTTNETFEGTVDLQEGAIVAQCPASFIAKDATVYEVTSARAGDSATIATGAAGKLIKRGNGRLQIETLPESTDRIDVQEGVLRFAPKMREEGVNVDAISATIPDPSFESYASNADLLKNGRIVYNTQDAERDFGTTGWKIYTPENATAGKGAVALFMYGHSSPLAAAEEAAPDGLVSTYLKQDFGLKCNVQIPEDGVYELSFCASARVNYYSAQNHIDLLIGKPGETPQWFGNLVKWPSPYYRHWYKTPTLEKGTYVLYFQARPFLIDGTTTIDDIQLRLAPEKEKQVVKIPNGDFEKLQIEKASEHLTGYYSLAHKAEGWELTSTGDGTYPRASLTHNGVSCLGESGWLNGGAIDVAGPNVSGFVSLALCSTGGIAKTTSDFVPPAGSWKLRADIARWATRFNNTSQGNSAIVHAFVSIDGGSYTSLGYFVVYNDYLMPETFPNSFTVDGSQKISIQLRQTHWNSSAIFDNLVLVPADEELVKNGSFEDTTFSTYNSVSGSCANWELTANWPETWPSGYATGANIDHFDRIPDVIATNRLDGICRLRLTGQASAKQTLSMQEGMHRLTFWTESRHNNSGSDIEQYGLNPVRAYIVKGSVTNNIGWARCDTTNYVQRSFLFNVPEAGNWTLHLQGMTQPGMNWGWSTTSLDHAAYIDLVSVKKVSDVPQTPDLSAKTSISVAEGARCELEFAGTQELNSLRLGDKSVSGIINKDTHPDWISGPGSFEVKPKGTVVMLI